MRGAWRRCCSSVAGSGSGKPIVAAAVLERLPLLSRPPHPTVASFRELSKKWKQIIGEVDVLELSLDDMKGRTADSSSQAKAAPVKPVDRKSLQRVLDQRLYLIVHGTPYKSQKGWHFPEKLYKDDEGNLRQCAASALESFLGDLTDVYFVGHAPSGHFDSPDCQRFYYRSHFVANKELAGNSTYKDYAWVTRDELSEYLDEKQLDLFKRMLPNF